MKKKMENENCSTNTELGNTRMTKTRANPFAIRFSPEENQTLETLRLRWQLATKGKVIHKLIGMAMLLEDKYQGIVREQEELKARFRI